MKKKYIRLKSLLLLFAVLSVCLCGCGGTDQSASTDAAKDLTIHVIHGDGSQKTFDISTQAENLADALVEHGIVEDNQSSYGLYILTADGETAQESNQEWWCITKSGESLATGASDTKIANGEVYELTLTVGY